MAPIMNTLTFLPIQRRDFPLLGSWLATPHVARWWDDDPALGAIEKDYGPCVDGTEPAEVFIACRDGEALGLIQRYKYKAYPAYLPNWRTFLRCLPAPPASII